jgi:hypothetical protein
MPLTPFQETVARLLSSHRDGESYLAGGAAMHIEPNSLRFSNDLDYFQDSESRVASAFKDDAELLVAQGFQVEVILDRPGFVRAVVKKSGAVDGGATKVEWVHDTAWRFLPLVRHEIAGLMLDPLDLAINKVLALVGRDEPRDYLDTVHAHQTILPLGALVWAAAGKDPGFSPGMLLDLLKRRGKIRGEDLVRLHLNKAVDLTQLKQSWLDALSEASSFIQRASAEELGCLYYSTITHKFVLPQEGEAVVPHYGRPGGVIPLVSE